MRRSPIISFVTISLLLGLSVAAIAAPKKKPPPSPPPPPTWTWSGYYLGLNLGYSWGQSNLTEILVDSGTGATLFTGTSTVNITGVIGGGQAGYNWQSGNWVFGIEADFQGSGERGSVTFTCAACSTSTVTASITERLDWFGTVRPRLGWTVTPTTMVYATGGLAYGELNDSGVISNGTAATSFSFSKVSAGWTAGGGIEGQLSGNWTWKVEYLFMELLEPSGSDPTSIPAVPAGCTPGFNCIPGVGNGHLNNNTDPSFTDNIVRAGINYKWP